MAPVNDIPDVLVIGAGASGAALSWRLGSEGFRVVCLEQGGWIPRDTLPTLSDDWELHRLSDLHIDPNIRRRPEDYPIENSESCFAPLMFNAVGGSTIHWVAHFPRFHPSDFRTRTLDGVGDDWPFTYEELEPFYNQNDREIGVAGLVGDTAYPAKSPRPTPPIPLGSYGETLVRGFEKLGWHWWPSDTALITTPYGENRQPCNFCGPCDLGCPRGARSSADVTYWPRAISQGVKLVTGARVREITVDAKGRARGALYYDSEGYLQEQRGTIVVVAANGIGTPRLLLNSRSRQFPEGLANRSGLVGKNLMYHPFGVVGGVFQERHDGRRGPVGGVIIGHEFYETDERRGFVRGFGFSSSRDPGPLRTALGGFTNQRVPWGPDHHKTYAERYEHVVSLAVTCEDLPEEHNEVVLDPVLTDSHGIPAPKVRYRMSENSNRMLDFGLDRAREVLEAAGALKTETCRDIRTSGWHLLGTARMGDDPKRSVADRWGRTHDVDNLFIIDGSLFTTSAATNPTTTIQALALRTADYIVNNRRNLL